MNLIEKLKELIYWNLKKKNQFTKLRKDSYVVVADTKSYYL